MQNKNKATDYFKRHPLSDECHITSDGRVFHNKGAAQGFAGTLKNSKIESYQRDTFLKDVESEDENGSQDSENEIQEVKEMLSKTPVEDMDYNTMKGLVKILNLEIEDQKKETLVVALEAFKKTLNEQ